MEDALIWHFFDDVKALYKETERLMLQQSQETDRKFQETDRKFQETERLMKQQSQETNKKIKEVSKSIGKLGNRLGDFVEEMVKPAAVRLFRERNIDVHMVSQNVKAERDGDAIEIDLLVVNDGELIAVECKSALSVEDVDDHLKRLAKIKKVLPHYRDVKVMGAVAGMVIAENVGRYAVKKGLFVLCQCGETMIIQNEEGFVPKVW